METNYFQKEVKASQFADNMLPYIENTKDVTQIMLELTNEFSKVTGYKINMQNSFAFLNTNNKFQKEILRKQPHLASHQKE